MDGGDRPPGLKIPFLAKLFVVLSRVAIGALFGGCAGLVIARGFLLAGRDPRIVILAGMILGALVVAGFWDRVFSRWFDHPGDR
jgi:hypothetical protein